MDIMLEQSTHKGQGKTLLLLAALGFTSTFATAVVFPNISSFVRDRFALSDTEASLFAVSYLVAHVLFSFIWGAISDRTGTRKSLLVFGYIATAVLHTLLPFAPTWPLLLLLRFAEGATNILGFSMVMTIAMDLARQGHHGRVMGMMGASVSLGTTLAFPVGGAIGSSSMVLLCSIGGIMLLACALAAAALLQVAPICSARSIAAALGVLRDHRRLLLPYVFTFIDRFTVGFFAVTFPLYVSAVHGMDATQAGMILAGFLLPFSILTWPFGALADKVGGVRMLLTGSLLYGIVVMFTGVVSPTMMPFLMVLCGVFAASMYAPSLWLVAKVAPHERRASAMGGFNAAGSIGFSLGPLVGGFVADTAGYTEAFYVAGISEILCVLFVLPILKRLAPIERDV